MALQIGQRVGEYEILSLLGAGGMGQVYSARNVISGRVEAMKILLPDFASEAELATRFTVEIRTLAALDHPNIAQLRTAFQFENQLVMIMEFVEGTTLEKFANGRPVTADDAINYSTQVLAALSYAHGKGVIHRDIKPANIMITSHGLAKVMDFGIAKSSSEAQLTRPGTTVGSVYYMSPEQVRGGTVDARSDIYSFGVTLYQMLTGRRPFEAENAYSVLTAQLNEIPVPPIHYNPALTPELNDIVLRAMVKAPDGRFQTAEQFRAALIQTQQPLGDATATVIATPAPVPPRPPAPQPGQAFPAMAPARFPAKNPGQRGLWIGLGAVAAIIAMIAATTLLPRGLATHASQQIAPAATDGPASAPQADGGSTSAVTQPMQPAPAPIAVVVAKPEATPRQATPSNPGASSAAAVPASQPQPPAPVAQVAAAAVPEAPLAPLTRQEVGQARERMIQLDSKAEAATSSIQQMRSQQQAQGFGMRGDIVGSMTRMNAYLDEAKRSLDENDFQAANANMDRAEKEISTLEKFLGR